MESKITIMRRNAEGVCFLEHWDERPCCILRASRPRSSKMAGLLGPGQGEDIILACESCVEAMQQQLQEQQNYRDATKPVKVLKAVGSQLKRLAKSACSTVKAVAKREGTWGRLAVKVGAIAVVSMVAYKLCNGVFSIEKPELPPPCVPEALEIALETVPPKESGGQPTWSSFCAFTGLPIDYKL